MIIYLILALLIATVLIPLSKFQKAGTPGGTITGTLCLLLSALGIFLLVSGATMIILTISLTASGDDATGLGIMVGSLIGVPGLVLCLFIFPAVRLLRLKIRNVRIIVILIAIFPIVFGIQSASSTRAKRNKWRQERQAQQDQLLAKFKTSDYVPVRVVSHIRMKTKDGYTVAPYPLREKLAIETLISPLEENIRIHKIAPWGDHDIYFDAQITRNAYDQLKQNHWVRDITLRDEY